MISKCWQRDPRWLNEVNWYCYLIISPPSAMCHVWMHHVQLDMVIIWYVPLHAACFELYYLYINGCTYHTFSLHFTITPLCVQQSRLCNLYLWSLSACTVLIMLIQIYRSWIACIIPSLGILFLHHTACNKPIMQNISSPFAHSHC